MSIECIRADLTQKSHADAILELLDLYARDECGGGAPLSDYSRANLIQELRNRPIASVFLASIDVSFVGLAICFEGFSTFSCKTILNIHDFAVHPNYRRRGISKHLLAKVEEHAHAIGSCKITLEVLQGNSPAKSAYESFGFRQYELDPTLGGA
eukprot:gene9774-20330_t